MTDPPGLQHPLGIEAVHWSVGTGADLVVRVAGRWRRRRPATAVAPVLVIDTELQRYRFSALPEPPSIRGAQPGLWLAAFRIPALLAPCLAGRLTLTLGSVSISLPAAVADPGDSAVPAGAGGAIPVDPDPIVVTDRRNRHVESVERRAPRPADVEREAQHPADDTAAAIGEARQRLDRLERELAQERGKTRKLRTELQRVEGKRREAEQLAHSEGAIRLDLERDQAVRLRRHQAHASAVVSLLGAVQVRARELAREVETLRRAVDEASRPLPVRSTAQPPGSRRAAERSDRPRQPAGAVAPDRLAAALYRLREASTPPELGPAPARTLAAASDSAAPPGRAADPGAAPRRPGGTRAPAAALDRAASRGQPSRWLLRALKRMLSEDPAVVGTVVLHLLPAQRLVVAWPVRYDLALGDAGCLAVTAHAGELRVERLGEARPLEEVQFRVEGDLAGLGRLLLYGSLRRRLSRRVARVRGDRRAFAALDRLVREGLGLRELYAAGVRLAPELTLQLVAHMIDPSWTAGARFTVAHESRGGDSRAYLLVRDGARPHVSRQPPLGPVATAIRCPDEQLLALLSGGSGAEVTVRGALAPVALLREWIARAERDS